MTERGPAPLNKVIVTQSSMCAACGSAVLVCVRQFVWSGCFLGGKCLLPSSAVEKQSSVKQFVSQQNRLKKKSVAVKLAVKHEHLMLTEH